MIFLLRPFKKTMLAQLRTLRNTELSNTGRNVIPDEVKDSLPELCRRGFVSTKTVIHDGKEILSVYLTQAGKLLLDQYEKNTKKLGSAYNIF